MLIPYEAIPRQPTFMERLMALMPTLHEPVFGIEFYRTTSGDHLANLNFGYVNETKARDGLVTASIGNNTIWMVNNISFIIGDLIDGVPVPIASGSKTPLTQDMVFGRRLLPWPGSQLSKADYRMVRHRWRLSIRR